METVKERIDAWLKPEPGVPTYPELIPAVCVAEENRHQLDKWLNDSARYIRQRYGIPVFVWLTDPLPPSPALIADGWIWDSYFWQYPEFRKHLMKFVSLGKPAICVTYAPDPAWRGYASGRFPDTRALINNTDQQFRICMEFDVSTAVFIVGGLAGSVGWWTAINTPDMIALRNWLRVKRAQAQAFAPGDLPLASANFSSRTHQAILFGDDPGAPSVYEESFDGFGWIEDADLEGFLDMKLTSQPEEEPGFLLAKTYPNRPVDAMLTYRFESYFPLKRVEVKLAGAAPVAQRCRNELAISLYGQWADRTLRSPSPGEDRWRLRVEQVGNETVETLSIGADEDFLNGAHTFYVRVSMQNHGDSETGPGEFANRLDQVQVRCVPIPPEPGAKVTLIRNTYHELEYEDNFTTLRWKYFGELNASAPAERSGYRDSGFWISTGPEVSSTRLVQRISAENLGLPKELAVTVKAFADSNLGGHVDLGIAPHGGKIQWKTSTDEHQDNEIDGVYKGDLTVKVPPDRMRAIAGDFDVHITLRSAS